MADLQQQQGPGTHYSGANPIMTVQRYLKSLKERDQLEREQEQRRLQAAQQAKAQRRDAPTSKGRKWVTDPVTGNEVEIDDADLNAAEMVDNPKLVVPNANLGKPTTVQTDANMPIEEYKETQDITAPPAPVAAGATSDVPIHGEKTNILFYPTPTISYEPMFAGLETKASVLCVGITVAIVFLGKMFGASLLGLIPTAACVSSGVYLWMKEVVRSGRELEWESEKKRGEVATANLIPESVEWLNTLIGVFWGLINPDMFVSVADTLEDIMQASVPGIIENVRVADINQGVNPPRILSLRALPDHHDSLKDLKASAHKEHVEHTDPEQALAEEEAGDFYNLELSLAYHASRTNASISSRARNMHMMLEFYVGIKGLGGVPLRIWVELDSLVVTARIRLMMIPEPPFFKTLTFTLMGVPKVSAGAVPLSDKGINVLNLPLISNFVNYSIAAAASLYVAPRSMSLDLGALISGDTVQKETQAIGVLVITIHRAEGLSQQDRSGSKDGGSDPYITLTFSKLGRPMYCTRVICDDLNPIYEETAVLLVTPNVIKANEMLSVELWDSDRHTADDIVGKVELSMQKMIQHARKMYPQESKLQGMDADSKMPGLLRWDVGFFAKPRFRAALRTDGKDQNLPDKLKDDKDLQDDKGLLNTPEADAVAHTPPDPLWPSGICAIVVHQIVSLELDDLQGTLGKRQHGREYEPAKQAGDIRQEEGGKLPSSYCTILLNDELVYRTRAKVVSSKPIFNAGTERFVRDWASAIVTVTVRDQRQREHDPIIGVVPLKLTDILQTSSQVTRWYPLQGGIGFGRIHISLLFRSVETQLPRSLLGWDVGTFEFISPKMLALGYTTTVKVKLRTGGSTAKVARSQCLKLAEGDGLYWAIGHAAGAGLRLPVKYRARSPVVLEFHVAGKRKADAYAVIWLREMVDNEVTAIDVPIWRTDSGMRLTQNYITEENLHTTPLQDHVTEVGRLQLRARFSPGLDEAHEHFIADNDARECYETWEACRAEGVRGRSVQAAVPAPVQQLHEQSLLDGRDMLKRASSADQKRWLAKDGTNWAGTFGHGGHGGHQPHDTVGDAHDDEAQDDVAHDDDSSSDDDDDDLGVRDAGNTRPSDLNGAAKASGGDPTTRGPDGGQGLEEQRKRTLRRQHRGMMQWKPVRNAVFAKDEAVFALRKVKHKMTGGMKGREPDVETELQS
ncbi:MAG: hypothetical protein M1826_000962 [Phylliscum demangeonii]|nr:MAG: hypothetical protein M1826_000962 [Phylliscum demangeonii]